MLNGASITGQIANQSDKLELALVVEHPELSEYLAQRIGNIVPVRVYDSAEGLMQSLHENRFGMVISEIRLPGLNGVELCRQIKKSADPNAMPVILMTALDSDLQMAKIADLCLVKPFSLFTLLEAIDRLWPGGPPQVGPDDAIHPVLAIANDALSDCQFDVSTWAEKTQLTSRELTRTVFHISGMTPTTWLREQRLRQVHRLISDGSCQSLIEAGMRCGFDNPDYLQRIYRVRFGEQ